MNRIVRQIINKFSYHRGIAIGKELRANLLKDAESLERQGKKPDEIIATLGLPLNPDNLNAQEAAKCP